VALGYEWECNFSLSWSSLAFHDRKSVPARFDPTCLRIWRRFIFPSPSSYRDWACGYPLNGDLPLLPKHITPSACSFFPALQLNLACTSFPNLFFPRNLPFPQRLRATLPRPGSPLLRLFFDGGRGWNRVGSPFNTILTHHTISGVEGSFVLFDRSSPPSILSG